MKKIRFPSTGTLTTFAIILAIIAGIGVYSRRGILFSHGERESSFAGVIVKTETMRADNTIAEKIIQNMSIDAVDRVELLPRVTGRLLTLSVKEGDAVRKGQVVATLEHDQQDALILSTAAEAASARADTEKERALMQNAKTDYERYVRLEKEGFSTKQQLESMQTEYESAAASYRAAVANERRYEAEAARVQSEKDDYIIRSPLDGVVLEDYDLTPGAMISSTSPILDIADPRRMKAALKIPESKIFSVKEGMPVRLTFDALPGESFEGSVTRIDKFVDPSTRMSGVEIALDNDKQAGGKLRPGMFGRAAIVVKEYSNVITLPESALRSSEKDRYVFVAENGKAHARVVETGVVEDSRVMITKGLKPGDEVIVFGGVNLLDGEAIEVHN